MSTFRPRQDGENLTDYLRAKQAFELAQSGTSSISFGDTPLSPPPVSSPTPTPPASGTALTQSTGGGAGNFTQIVKTPNSPQVYGLLPSGQWIAFNSMDQLPQGAQIQTVQTAPTGAYSYNEYFNAGQTPQGGPQTGLPTGGSTPATGADPNALPSTGNPQLDAIQAQLMALLKQKQDNGQIINPNVQLSPQTIQQFLDQATSEISPYYASQIGLVKDQITAGIANLQTQYDYQVQNEQQSFKDSLESQRESAAGAGLAFSGQRNLGEQTALEGEQRKLDYLGSQTVYQGGQQLSTAAGQIGTANLPTTLPSIQVPHATLAGIGGFDTSQSRALSFAPVTPGVTGSLQYGQQADIGNLSRYLQQQEIQKRSLGLTPTP